MKKGKKIAIALIIGFAVSLVILFIAIWIGYTNAYSTDVETLTVRILGIPVYELTRSGGAYTGQAQNMMMGLVSGICMFASVLIGEALNHKREK